MPPVPYLVGKRPCGPRAGPYGSLRRKEEKRPAHAAPYSRHVPVSGSPCVARREAASRWRLYSFRATFLCEPRTFRLRVAVTGDAPTAPSPETELAGGGSWEAPAGAAAPGIAVGGAVAVAPSAGPPATSGEKEAAFAVAPPQASTCTSGGRGVASVSAADAVVAMSSSAALWRMHERKEDMRSAVGGGGHSRNWIRVNLHASAEKR